MHIIVRFVKAVESVLSDEKKEKFMTEAISRGQAGSGDYSEYPYDWKRSVKEWIDGLVMSGEIRPRTSYSIP